MTTSMKQNTCTKCKVWISERQDKYHNHNCVDCSDNCWSL